MLLVVLSPYFLYQAMRHNKYLGSLGQRFGYLPVSFNLDGDPSIWVHAVSVGEVLAARTCPRVSAWLLCAAPPLSGAEAVSVHHDVVGPAARTSQRGRCGRLVLSAI